MLRILEHQSHPVAQFSQVKIFLINILSMKIDRSRGCLHQTIQMLDQRRLSGTGMTDDADELSVLNLKVHIL